MGRHQKGNEKDIHNVYRDPSSADKVLPIRGRVTIQWKDDPESCHTCGWLLSEFIRRTEPEHLYNSVEAVKTHEYTTIAIKSKGSQHITLDSYLTQVERSLSILPNNEELEAVQVPTVEIMRLSRSQELH